MLIPYLKHNIFAFADTHGLHNRLTIPPETDILICAGDGVNNIDDDELQRFLCWYANQPAKLRIFIAGNHELQFDLYPQEAVAMIPKGITFLENSGCEYDGISFYSVAARPWLHQENRLPANIDFLITHGPAKGFLDDNNGCCLLRNMILKYKPHYHIFGHIHSLGNQIKTEAKTSFLNVSYFNQFD